MRQLILVLMLVLLTTGCTTLGTMTPPDVSLVDMELTDVTVFETTGTITVRLTNENPEPLVIDGSVFKLYLNGMPVGKALDAERLEVPRLGTATQTVNLHINNVALIARLTGCPAEEKQQQAHEEHAQDGLLHQDVEKDGGGI